MNNKLVAPEIVNSDSSKMLREWLTVLTGVFFVFVTAALYAAGEANRTGYLYQLGFDVEQIPSTFQYILYWGFGSSAPQTLMMLGFVVVGILLLAFVGWLTSKWQKAPSKITRASKEETRDHSRSKAPSSSENRMLVSFALLTAGVAGLIFVICLMLVTFNQAGTARGGRLIAAFQSNARATAAKENIQWIEITLDAAHPRVEAGYRLQCTEKLCSIFDPTPGRKGVRVIALDGLKEIRVTSPPSEF